MNYPASLFLNITCTNVPPYASRFNEIIGFETAPDFESLSPQTFEMKG
jgi:hypothetical protein